jgi:Na+/proline symporter
MKILNRLDGMHVISAATGALLITHIFQWFKEGNIAYLWIGAIVTILMWLTFIKARREPMSQASQKHEMARAFIIAVVGAILSGLLRSAVEWVASLRQ